VKNISALELADWLARAQAEGGGSDSAPILLDVREPWEFETCRIQGAILIPMQQIPARQGEIDDERPIVCICHHGARSMQVALFLERQGHQDVYNLTGGVDAWARQVDATLALY